jgi:single-stranded-DNA-specific exonuclease
MGGDIRPYIPHRLREGYGLNTEAIEQLAAEGVRLLITVDCGISNVREVAQAQERGIDVIVTDHHTPPAMLPEAYAVVNPKQAGCEYPYKQLVGVGIAYKLVQALARLGVKMPLRGRDLLDVVALGTVTDMGPLNGENRVHGVRQRALSRSPPRSGRALRRDLAAGWYRARSAPTILALCWAAAECGRADRLALLAFHQLLLLADDFPAARTLADTLNQANRRRQD